MALEELYFGAERAHRVRGRPGARRGDARRRPARHALRGLHAAAGQGRGLRQRARGQGPGAAAWSRRCSGWPSRRGPTTPPTRSPWRSATPTARRCARRASGAGVIALVRGEVGVRRPDHVVVTAAASATGRRLGRDAAPRPARRRAGHAARPPDRPRRRAHPVRLRLRAGARPVPGCCRRAGGRPEGGARRCSRAAPPRELLAAHRRRRRGPLPGRAGHRQAHGRADHRRAAREGRAADRATTAISITRAVDADDPRGLARDGLLELGYAPAEVDELLADAEGDSAEELSPRALRGGPPMTTPARIQTPERARPRTSSTARCARSGSRTSSGSTTVKRAARAVDRGGAARGDAARPRAAGRPARPGQDVARADRRGRARRRLRSRPPGRRWSARATSPRS